MQFSWKSNLQPEAWITQKVSISFLIFDCSFFLWCRSLNKLNVVTECQDLPTAQKDFTMSWKTVGKKMKWLDQPLRLYNGNWRNSSNLTQHSTKNWTNLKAALRFKCILSWAILSLLESNIFNNKCRKKTLYYFNTEILGQCRLVIELQGMVVKCDEWWWMVHYSNIEKLSSC